MNQSKTRVVLTGLGVCSPLGIGITPYWNNFLSGVNVLKRIKSFSTAEFECKHAFQMNERDLMNNTGHITSHYVSRPNRLLLVSVKSALTDARIKDYIGREVAVFTALPYGNWDFGADFYRKLMVSGPDGVDPMAFPPTLINYSSSYISTSYQFKGPNITFASGIHAGIEAVNFAARLIRQGYITQAVVSGVNVLVGDVWAMWALRNKLQVSLKRGSVGIFDAQRDGFLLGENASTLVLEDAGVAKRRKARVYAEVLGGGLSFGKSQQDYCRSMGTALYNSRLFYKDIDVCVLNSNGLKSVDSAEISALQALLKERISQIEFVAPKENNGECEGASGVLQALIGAKCISSKIVPSFSSRQYKHPRLADGLAVRYGARRKTVQNVLINSFDVDGGNAALVLGKF
ncbi:MAG: beta-ketoacyl synthase N-terminal-like domain-containing protein [Candidatus Omnitrophota bacterium]